MAEYLPYFNSSNINRTYKGTQLKHQDTNLNLFQNV